MPVPIGRVPDNVRESKNIGMDYSFLFNAPPVEKKTVTASNKDASLLLEIWSKGERMEKSDSIKIANINVPSRDIMRLKTMGFIMGDTSEVKFTKRGKIVITTMTLGEESAFEKNKVEKPYSEILASLSKKTKPGYRIPKFASNNNNNLNLRKS